MKQIIYSLLMLLLLLSCGKSDEVDYSALQVDFLRDKVDVGENSGMLEIPVVLSGCKSDVPLAVSVQISATDHSAVAGVDYELLDKQLVFNNSGASVVRVRIMDNPEITDTMKEFTLSLKVETSGVQTKMSTAKVYIISDDVEEMVLTGFYTLTARDFIKNTNYASAKGGVEIVQDETMPERYYLRDFVLLNGKKVLPLTKAEELYITKDTNGDLTMPMMQNIGDYGMGDGFTIGLTSDASTSETPIKIQLSGNKLVFMMAGLGGIAVDEKDALTVYYALKDIVLEKVTR